MQIIIPMSGASRRFLEKGYSFKQLIDVEGEPIIKYVVDLFPGEKEFIFICDEKHLKETNLRQVLKRIMPSGKIVGIKPKYLGPVPDILQVKKYIKDDEEVIINYCDFNIEWNSDDFKQKINKTNCEGSVVCYTGFHPHLLRNQLYTGVKVDENNFITDIKEKHRFTKDPAQTWHAAGVFYFRKGKYIKKYFNEVIKKKMRVNGEYYVSTVYELLLKDKLSCYVYPAKRFFQWGTPEDFREYLWWADLFKKIHSGLIAEETLKFKKPEGRKIFNYWKGYFDRYIL